MKTIEAFHDELDYRELNNGRLLICRDVVESRWGISALNIRLSLSKKKEAGFLPFKIHLQSSYQQWFTENDNWCYFYQELGNAMRELFSTDCGEHVVWVKVEAID